MAAGWAGGRNPDPSKRIDYQVEVNMRKIRISVPGGGRSAAPTDPGPLIVPRIDSPNFGARLIFAQQYGKNTTLGREFGDFKISLDVVSVPARLGEIPEHQEDLVEFIKSSSAVPLDTGLVTVSGRTWVVEEVPNAIFGHSFLYSMRLDGDALIMLRFSLDRNRMQSDQAWLEARKRDIEGVLRSFVEE